MNKNLYDDIYTSNNIISGEEYREITSTISQLASDMVVTTLGPYGATTILDDGSSYTYPSKDGWSALRSLKFNDPIYNTIFNLIRQVSFNSVSKVGDGTTTAMVAANRFLQEMNNWTDKPKDFRQADFISDINKIVDVISDELENSPNLKRVSSDNNYEDIYKIANIATNGNEKFANIIRTIYAETDNPNIHIDLAPNSPDTYFEINDGYKIDCRVLFRDYYVNAENKLIKFTSTNNTRCIIFDHNVTYTDHKVIVEALSRMSSNGFIIIMAPYFDDIISSIIESNCIALARNGQIPSVILMQIPTTMNYHKKSLSDLGLIANCTIFDTGMLTAFKTLYHNQTIEDNKMDESILELDRYKFESPQEIIENCLGRIVDITIDKESAYITNFESVANMTLMNAEIENAKEEYESLKIQADKTINGRLDKDYMQAHMRYVKLLSKTGVIHVGGLSDLQRKCDKDAIDDAVLACKSAFEAGYIRGMNLETLHIIDDLKANMYDESNPIPKDLSYTEKILDMLLITFFDVTLSVMRNKYESTNVPILVDVVKDNEVKDTKIFDSGSELIMHCVNNDYGYNLVTNRIEDLNSLTVINSIDTDLEILKATVNILTTIMTSSQFLSMNRSYDRVANHDIALRRQIDDRVKTAKAVTKAVIDTIKEDEEFMASLYSIFSPNSMPLEYIDEDDMEDMDSIHGGRLSELFESLFGDIDNEPFNTIPVEVEESTSVNGVHLTDNGSTFGHIKAPVIKTSIIDNTEIDDKY